MSILKHSIRSNAWLIGFLLCGQFVYGQNPGPNVPNTPCPDDQGNYPYTDACGNGVCDPPDPNEACCGGALYDSSTSGCCNGTIYDLTTEACCGDQKYDSSYQGCCGGDVYQTTAPSALDCCGNAESGETYNFHTEDCCDDLSVARGSEVCCGSPSTTVDSSSCCDDGTVASQGEECCGSPSTAYDVSNPPCTGATWNSNVCDWDPPSGGDSCATYNWETCEWIYPYTDACEGHKGSCQ